MPSTRQGTSRKRNLRNGALLAVSETAKLVNIPLAHDVARHIQQIAAALKAPKINDLSAQKLAQHVQALLDTLNVAIQYLKPLGAGAHGNMLIELCELQIRLSKILTELQDIQSSQYTTKLASQTEVRERILGLKEELSQTITDLTLRLLVTVLDLSAQYQVVTVLVRRLDTTAREHATLVREHKTLVRQHSSLARQHTSISRKHTTLARKHRTLVRITERRQRTSETRIRRLEGTCDAILLLRQTDGQRIAYSVLLIGVPFFF